MSFCPQLDDLKRLSYVKQNNCFFVIENQLAGSVVFTPFEISCVYCLVRELSFVDETFKVSPGNFREMLQKRIGNLNLEDDLRGSTVLRIFLIMEALMKVSRELTGVSFDDMIPTKVMAFRFEENPINAFGELICRGAVLKKLPCTMEFLFEHPHIKRKGHLKIFKTLTRLDTDKDGVFSNLLIAHRDLTICVRECLKEVISHFPVSEQIEIQTQEIVRYIMNSACLNELGEVCFSEIIESYSMECCIIPEEHSAQENAALTHRMELSDYSLLLTALKSIGPVSQEELQNRLFECVAVQGVVTDDCSLNSVVNAVVAFVEERMKYKCSCATAIQELMNKLIVEPNSFHIPVMHPRRCQEVMVRKMQLTLRSSAIVCILQTLLLLDVNGNGILEKSVLEVAILTALSQLPPNTTKHYDVDRVDRLYGCSSDRLKTIVHHIILSMPEKPSSSSGSQEIDTNYFIELLISETSIIQPFFVPMPAVTFPNVKAQLNEIEHLYQLLNTYVIKEKGGSIAVNPEEYGFVTENELFSILNEALKTQRRNIDVLYEIVALFKRCSLNFSVDGAFDISHLINVVEFRTDAVVIPVNSLHKRYPMYGDALAAKFIAKENVRNLSKCFLLIDKEHNNHLCIHDLVCAGGPWTVSYLTTDNKVPNSILPAGSSAEDAKKLFDSFDVDKDGKLCLNEFIASFNKEGRMGNGVLTMEQVKALAKQGNKRQYQ
eukprot:Tbor_TRINITY_DN5829_c0_g5::TRINITY_DN5829_c0_g5_i1::g.7228::m.7228